MKPLNPIVVWLADSTFSVAILVGSLSLASVLHAPVWLMPVFFAPLAIYLHFRAQPHGEGLRWFLAISLFVLFVMIVAELLPASLRHTIGLMIFFAWVAVASGRQLLNRWANGPE